MRPLTPEETEVVLRKLAKYLGPKTEALIAREDGQYCFRLHQERVYYASEELMRKAGLVPRDQLVMFGTCLGKFTKSRHFLLHITALDCLAPYAKTKVWLKAGGEGGFVYGNHVVKSMVARVSESGLANDGAVVFSASEVPLGFGVMAKSAASISRAEPSSIVLLHQADVGQYLRQEATLT